MLVAGHEVIIHNLFNCLRQWNRSMFNLCVHLLGNSYNEFNEFKPHKFSGWVLLVMRLIVVHLRKHEAQSIAEDCLLVNKMCLVCKFSEVSKINCRKIAETCIEIKNFLEFVVKIQKLSFNLIQFFLFLYDFVKFPKVFVKFEASCNNYRVVSFPTAEYAWILNEFSFFDNVLNFPWFLSDCFFSNWCQNFIHINVRLLNCIVSFVIIRLKLIFEVILTYIVDNKVLLARWTECKVQIDLFSANQSANMKGVVQNRFGIQSSFEN